MRLIRKKGKFEGVSLRVCPDAIHCAVKADLSYCALRDGGVGIWMVAEDLSRVGIRVYHNVNQVCVQFREEDT